MRTLTWIVKVSWIAVLATACSSPPGIVSTTLRLEMPLTDSLVDYVGVTAFQGQSTVAAVPDSKGYVHLSILAGVEARLVATVFSVDNNRWRSFEGTHIFVPQAGSNDIEIEPKAVALRQGSIVPMLIDPNTRTIVPWERPLAITLTDAATGHSNHDDELFSTNTRFEIPKGRSLTVTITRPDNAEAFTFDLGAATDDFVAHGVPIGNAPLLPAPLTVATNDPAAIDIAAQLQTPPEFPLECAVTDSCDAPDAAWQGCDDLGLSGVAGEQQLNVMVRYEEIPELGCTPIVVDIDSTPPFAALQFEPPFINDAVLPARVDVILRPNEALDSSSLRLFAQGTNQGNYACPRFFEIAQSAGPPSYACSLDLETWVPDHGNIEIWVEGTDAAGNPFASLPRKILRHFGDANGDLLVVGVRTYPTNPSPGGNGMLLGIDVVNVTGRDAPQNWLCGLQPSSLSFSIGDQPTDRLHWEIYSGPFITRLPPSTLDAPIVQTMWVPINVTEQLEAQDYTAGEFNVDMSILSSVGDRDCLNTSKPFESAAQGSFELTDVPLEWLGDHPLGIAVDLWWTRTITAPFVGGPTPRDSYAHVLSSSDPRVDTLSGDGAQQLRGRAPGQADVTVTAGGESAAVHVQVSPPPSVLALQDDRLTVLTPTSSETLIVAGTLGMPIRALWESTTDTIVVVGEHGVQRFPAIVDSTVDSPCGSVTIFDGQLTPATDTAPPGVALLTQSADGFLVHCEIPFGNWSNTAAVAFTLSPDEICGNATGLLSDPLTGGFTILGDGCAARYRTTADRITDIAQADGIFAETDIERVALDPFGSFAAYTTTSGNAGGWRLGTTLDAGDPWGLPETVADVAIDPATGTPYVATRSLFAQPPVTSVMAINERLYASGVSDVGEVMIASGESISRLAIDAGSRFIYAAINSYGAPEIRVVDLDYLSSVNNNRRFVLPTHSHILDLAIAGPQVVDIEPRAAAPGQTVAIFGTGFSGENRDEVYVGGVRAELLRSTATSAVFRVPADFGLYNSNPIDAPSTQLDVTVRAHGRMSGPGITPLTLWPRAPARRLGFYGAPPSYCNFTSCAAPTAILETHTGIWTARSAPDGQGLTRNDSSATTFFSTTAPMQAVAIPGGRRVIAHDGDVLYELRLPKPYQQEATESERPVDWPAGPLGAMAADPTGRYLAVDASGVKLLYATTVTAAPLTLPPSIVTPIEVLRFFPDGNAIAAANAQGALEVLQIEPAASTPVSVVGDDCRNEGTELLGLWPQTIAGPAVSGLVYDRAASTLSLFTVEARMGAFELRCTTSVSTGDRPPAMAAMSPYGDFVAVLADGGADGTYDALQLLDTADLTHELEYRLMFNPVLGMHVAIGTSWESPVLVLVGPYSTEFLPVTVTAMGDIP